MESREFRGIPLHVVPGLNLDTQFPGSSGRQLEHLLVSKPEVSIEVPKSVPVVIPCSVERVRARPGVLVDYNPAEDRRCRRVSLLVRNDKVDGRACSSEVNICFRVRQIIFRIQQILQKTKLIIIFIALFNCKTSGF